MVAGLHLLLALVCVSFRQGHAQACASASGGDSTGYEHDVSKFRIVMEDANNQEFFILLTDPKFCNNVVGAKTRAVAQTGNVQVFFFHKEGKRYLGIRHTGPRKDVQYTGKIYCAHD